MDSVAKTNVKMPTISLDNSVFLIISLVLSTISLMMLVGVKNSPPFCPSAVGTCLRLSQQVCNLFFDFEKFLEYLKTFFLIVGVIATIL
jgi:hypothetical protein